MTTRTRRRSKRTIQVVEAPTLDDALLEVEYRAGYLLAVQPIPVAGGFDIRRDMMLIEKGTHFWCSSHAEAVPVEQRSPRKPDYCLACVEGMRD